MNSETRFINVCGHMVAVDVPAIEKNKKARFAITIALGFAAGFLAHALGM